jgi:hypothetical protein
MVHAKRGNEAAPTGLVFDGAHIPVGRVSIPDTSPSIHYRSQSFTFDMNGEKQYEMS